MTCRDEDKLLNTTNSSQKLPVMDGKWSEWTRVIRTDGQRDGHTAQLGEQSSGQPGGLEGPERGERPGQDHPWRSLASRTKS